MHWTGPIWFLGDAYYKISQYDSASIYLNKSLHSEDHYTKAGAYMRLADIAKKQGLLEKALEMERKYSSYLDSAQQKQQSAEIVTAEKKYTNTAQTIRIQSKLRSSLLLYSHRNSDFS